MFSEKGSNFPINQLTSFECVSTEDYLYWIPAGSVLPPAILGVFAAMGKVYRSGSLGQ